MKTHIKSKTILSIFIILMAGMIGFAVIFKDTFIALLKNPVLQEHARFIHILSISLFFTNAVVGILWEKRSFVTENKEIILHTYNTVAFLDSIFSSPLIILSLLSGLSLSFQMGSLWQIGWLSVSFLLFILSGVIWVASDIPTQYKVKRLMSRISQDDQKLPRELVRILKLRWWISMAGVLPLLVVFILMVYKPYINVVVHWFN